eukprot:TRINITY_DN4899_c0_g1_i1.p1 TRINITY_DN4899_c0_g1~~TRINITY_DN4899_c0_g1_i1.p1  ORF type:complete len:406 (+),score=104.90 TRINITY_DN4899_c0_g1_i1:43-1218(+)
MEEPTESGAPVVKKPSIGDYELHHILGEGAFGDVFLATQINTGEKFAIKQMLKSQMTRQNTPFVMNERNALSKCNHPNIVSMYAAFRDPDFFYYVLSLAENGELLKFIRNTNGKGLSVDAVRFIAAEIIVALEHLHTEVGIIHRDLKPENILVGEDFHILITDFGTSKLIDCEEGKIPRKGSFVGTAQYIPPELITDSLSCFSMDLWSLGCVIYQMACARAPFTGFNQFYTMKKVQEGIDAVSWPEPFPDVIKDLVIKLLKFNPEERLGANGFADLKAHPFFQEIDWDNLSTMAPPPFIATEVEMIWAEDVLKEEENIRRQKAEELRETWAMFLEEDEQIVESGHIIKFRKLSQKKRFLILTDKPRLLYIDEKNMEKKVCVFSISILSVWT